MAPEHQAKAHNTFGIFYPVIHYNGRIIGNWKKNVKKNQVTIETSFFEKHTVNKKLIQKATEKYQNFLFG